jgi:hypothetical protein
VSYLSFPKSDTLINAVIRHLHPETVMGDISNAFVGQGFGIVNVKQMMSKTAIKEGENQGVSRKKENE